MSRKPFDTGRSVADKLADIKQNEEIINIEAPTLPDPLPREKKPNYKIDLDLATRETLKQKHNLVEGRAKASFHWNASFHKELKKMAIDTGKPLENYLEEWAIEGFERERKKLK